MADEAGKPLYFSGCSCSDMKPICCVLDGLTVYKYMITDYGGVAVQNNMETVLPSGGEEVWQQET